MCGRRWGVQGGDMLNCLTLWKDSLVSGGDGGELLLRYTLALVQCSVGQCSTVQLSVGQCSSV